MSQFRQNETCMSNPKHLMDALTELGFKPTLHETPINLYGYQGDQRPEVANIVIPRVQIGSLSNDLGFVLKDGKYQAIISDYDSRRFNQSWLGKLTQTYKEKQAMSDAKLKGYNFAGKRVVNNRVVLEFTAR